MSLFQCEHCGCCENTALSCQGFKGPAASFFDWTGIEERSGKKLCSACGPVRYSDGKPSEFGRWHELFPRVFLPLGMFRTGRDGNLEHVATGDRDFRRYAIADPAERDGSYLAKVFGPTGAVWAIAPDASWRLRGSPWPPIGELVDTCYASRHKDPPEYGYGRARLESTDGYLSNWQNERGESIAFNPDFWRPTQREHDGS